MIDERVHIRLFSDNEDQTSIHTALKQLELKNVKIKLSHPKSFDVSYDDIVIACPSDINSKIITKLIALKKSVKNKIFFIIENNNAVFVSSLVKLGFSDIFVFPFELYRFISHIHEIIVNNQYKTRPTTFRPTVVSLTDLRILLGDSKEIYRIINLSKTLPEKVGLNLLLLGETGTGKGLLAQSIHYHSMDPSTPFVDILCTAIPESLIESELFGHEPGAYTNARTRKFGLFELAEKGTLFLDEIGDLGFSIQSKLLRSIEKKIIRRLGGVVDIPINTRIISATNRDLEDQVNKNLFRRDLFHRLNVISIRLLPLRERRGDILGIANYYIDQFNTQFNKNIKRIESDAKSFLLYYTWPGNIRELRNAIERAVILSDSSSLKLKYFSVVFDRIPVGKTSMPEISQQPPHIINLNFNYLNTGARDFERIYAKEVLNRVNGNKFQAAKILKISRPKLDSLLK